MTKEDQVRHALVAIEQALHDSAFWQSSPPDVDAFASTEPFCLDTLRPEQWLQWVMLPRLHAMLDGGVPLPSALAVTPYFEEALTGDSAAILLLLAPLRTLDTLFMPADAQGDADA